MTRDRFISEVRTCQGPLRQFLASLCGDTALADDIAQEALVRAYVASDRFVGNFKAWLFRIAYNCFIDNLRRLPPSPLSIDSTEVMREADGAIGARPDGAFRNEELRQALARIPEKERTAIILHYFEDLSVKEIAAVMQIPAGTVKYHLSMGRTRLKQYIRL
jgi:RNA polymerase sigma-70 factor (ECF subfamily)